MPTLFAYILRELLKSLVVILIVVVVIYLTVDFLAKIDKFVEAGVTESRMLAFFALKTPQIIFQIMPVAVLLSTLVVFGLMHRHNEVVAIRSGGINPRILLRPVVVSGLGFCLVMFLLSEMVIPVTTSQANLIWLKEVRKKRSMTVKQNDLWIKDKQAVFHIGRYQPAKQTAYGFTMHFFDDRFRLQRRIDAEKAYYKGGQWVLENMQELRFDPDGRVAGTVLEPQQTLSLDILPQDLGRAAKNPEEMGLMELYRLIQQVAEQGYDTTGYRVALHAKLAFPLVCLLMSLIGAGIGLSGRTLGGMTANLAYGLGASFVYWIVYSFSLSLGHGGLLPPVAAAWAANGLFVGLAALAIKYID